jgi:hypothetical protein
VGLVAGDQVPTAFGRLEFLLNVFVAREFVQPSNDKIVFAEPISRTRSPKFIVGWKRLEEED